ncbi:MAG: hypothetical protein AAF383_11870 [Cyanobacteria bacterium P01_A01_bin.83]
MHWTWRKFVGTPNEESTHRRGLTPVGIAYMRTSPLSLTTKGVEGGEEVNTLKKIGIATAVVFPYQR